MATAEQSGAPGGGGGQAQQRAQEVAGQAEEKAQQAAGQAKQQAQHAAGQARERVRQQVDERSTEAGQQIRSQASDARSIADQLRQQGKDRPAHLAEQAADRAERLGSYLEESDAERILGDVEDFARRRPWAVVAGGIAVGFAASRFLKASSGERYQQSVARSGSAGTPARANGVGSPPAEQPVHAGVV